MPTLSRITIYPIKSFDGVEVTQARILPTGALQGDRQFALVDEDKKFVNGKRFPAIHTIRATYSNDLEQIDLSSPTGEVTFSLVNQHEQMAAWCSEILDTRCRLVENTQNGFPDDLDALGPTIISTPTLQQIGSWFNLDPREIGRRLRANLEIDSEQPFWEDQLVGPAGQQARFSIGPTVWQGTGICQRCPVPTRDSRSGVVTEKFAAEFSRQRQQSLPDWSPADRFDHYYRSAVNTKLESLDQGNQISVGDRLELFQGASL